MADCVSCGTALKDVALFCPHCGTAVEAASAPSDEADPAGEAAPSDEADPAGEAAPADEVAPIAPIATSKGCSSCGEQLPDDAQFCGACGTPVADGGVAVPLSPPASPNARPTVVGPQAHVAGPQAIPMPGGASGFSAAGGNANQFNDFLAFRKLVTPGILQATFWLVEALNVFLWIRYMINGSFGGSYYGAPGTNGWNVVGGLLGLVAMAFIIRVFLELAMIVFRKNGPEGR